jgi:hypothetical protein
MLQGAESRTRAICVWRGSRSRASSWRIHALFIVVPVLTIARSPYNSGWVTRYMWPRLKYRLEVRGRSPGNVAVSASCSFHDWSPGGFSEVLPAWPVCLVSRFPPVGVTWRGYAAPRTILWTVADTWGDMAFWQALSHLIVLYKPAWPLTAFPNEM